MDFSHVRQVIGVAYTYRPSRPVRHQMASERVDHSSHHRDFSYFRKIDAPEDIVRNGEPLQLRNHPFNGRDVVHGSEPEIAIWLAQNHRIAGYCLANDFTAYGLELTDLGPGQDPTYYGKCWKGSCALGEFIPAEHVRNEAEWVVKMAITREGRRIYEGQYSTASRLRPFSELADQILRYHRELHERMKGALPLSKQIQLMDEKLPEGTVILTGSGIVKIGGTSAARIGDRIRIECDGLGELENPVNQ